MAKHMVQVPRAGGHKFSEVPKAEIQRSSFDRTFGLKTAFDAGWLIPIYVDEALPGDTFNMSVQGFCRLATPIKPLMDNLYIETFYFAVPNRLLWDNWEKFNGAQDNPGDSTDYTVPKLDLTDRTGVYNDLYDYMGIPPNLANLSVTAFWPRAYNLIWNEFFRDENLQDSVHFTKSDGGEGYGNYNLLRRGKRHDYFTSCLPWPQKGPAVTIPLGDLAPVIGIGKETKAYVDGPVTVYESDGSQRQYTYASDPGAFAGIWAIEGDDDTDGVPMIYADMSNVTGTTINDLRQSFQIQRLLERDARGGTRYTEVLKSHFGVTSPDARLQRPEYLGGSTGRITVSPVAQTTSTDATTPQGNLAAVGTGTFSGSGFVKSFTEHMTILGLCSVRADLNYQQGINRMWSRSTRFDYYWPALAHLGEQAVLNQEIYAQGTATDDLVFGYQERYAEYRYKPNEVSGLMRSNVPGSLDIWHLSQDFDALPLLNGSFIQEDPPVDRVIAVQEEPHLLLDMHFSLKCARPMPLYGVPGLIDHF